MRKPYATRCAGSRSCWKSSGARRRPTASQNTKSERSLRLRELEREAAEVDDRTCSTQEIHAEDPSDLESIVHLADLDIEVVEAMIADREPIDLA